MFALAGRRLTGNDGRRKMNAFPNRPMKFWELTSAFRECQEELQVVLTSPRWMSPYGKYLADLKSITASQDRDILDSPVPLDLSRELCRRSAAVFVLSPDRTTLRRFLPEAMGYSDQKDLSKLSAVEVSDRFGPAVIEEVLERGSAIVHEGSETTPIRSAQTGGESFGGVYFATTPKS